MLVCHLVSPRVAGGCGHRIYVGKMAVLVGDRIFDNRQDRLQGRGTTLDIRVSTIPTIYAESISLRLLDERKKACTMDRLGMRADDQAQIEPGARLPARDLLVAGPTGSGKSTSLNAFLRQINSTDLRIITIEDPNGYEVPASTRCRSGRVGPTFASASATSCARTPTSSWWAKSATGRRPTSRSAPRSRGTWSSPRSTRTTLPGAITRLVDMGIEPFLVASAIELVIAQRLVRRLCPECTRPEPVAKIKLLESLAILGCDAAEADTITTLGARSDATGAGAPATAGGSGSSRSSA